MSEAKRILFLIRSLEGQGGAERQLATLAIGLRQRGWDVLVVTSYDGGEREAALRAADVRVASLGKSSKWATLGAMFRLAAILRRERPDVVHGYMTDANVMLAALKPLTRPAMLVWGVRASDVDYSRYGRTSAIAFGLSCRLALFADLIICNSKSGADFHAKHGYPRDRMITIPNGIDTERFRPLPAARIAMRQRWNVAQNEPLIGLVGRFDPMKDHESFIRAAALFLEKRRATFVCVGWGGPELAGELRSLAARLGIADRVRFEPPVADVAEVYNALDILTLCSIYGEGFPNVVGEALACGTACVVTDVGDAPTVVGEASAVVPRRDPAALSARWNEILGDSPQSSADDRRARVTERFSVARLIETTAAAVSRAATP